MKHKIPYLTGIGKGIEAFEARDSLEPRAESVDFHKLSPSEIVSPIDIDFLNLEEPPLDVLELEPPRNIQLIKYNRRSIFKPWLMYIFTSFFNVVYNKERLL